jgi:hypothetical protein
MRELFLDCTFSLKPQTMAHHSNRHSHTTTITASKLSPSPNPLTHSCKQKADVFSFGVVLWELLTWWV